VIGLILFGKNHMYVKMLFNRDSAIQKCFRRFCTAYKSEDFRFPISRLDDHAIPSGRRGLPSGPFTATRSFCSSLHPSRHISSPSGRLSVCDQASDSFQNYIWEDCCNHPDDMDSRQDALLFKARIAIQIQPFGRLSAWSGSAFN
jgi:hypothetical protein